MGRKERGKEKDSRNLILNRLRSSVSEVCPARGVRPGLADPPWTGEELIDLFLKNLADLAVPVYRVKDYQGALSALSEIAEGEGWKKIVASTDPVISALPLKEWGRDKAVEVFYPGDSAGDDACRKVLFEEAEAGISGVDYALAESGTLVLLHNRHQPRLVSLAPPSHVALVPASSLLAVYEELAGRIFFPEGDPPAQVTFITGPSMTADIQMTLFRGMHGPRNLIVVFIEAL